MTIVNNPEDWMIFHLLRTEKQAKILKLGKGFLSGYCLRFYFY